MSTTMVGRRQKNLKCPKAVPKSEIWTKISMIENAIFGILVLKIIFRGYNFFIFVQTFQRTSSEFHFNFSFSNRKSQSQQKLANKIIHFTIQFHSKNLTHFMKFNSFDIESNMVPQCSQKPF